MKIFRVDTSLKHINFQLDGKRYSIIFRDTARKGVHDVSVWVDGNESPAHITGTYPPLKRVLADLRQIHFPLWLRFKKRSKNQIALTEKDQTCIARIFQGFIYKDGDMFHCCRYCAYEKECSANVRLHQQLHFDRVREKLQDITGVHLSLDAHDIEKKFQLPTNKPVCKQ